MSRKGVNWRTGKVFDFRRENSPDSPEPIFEYVENDNPVATVTANGAKGYVFHDTMETGLTYNNDAAVTGVEEGAATYTVEQEGDDPFTITFDDDYIKTLEVGSTLTVTYSATVNDDAITTDPLNNTCYVSYGDESAQNKTPDSEADVYEAKFTVTKKDGDDGPLANAGFVLKNDEGKYYIRSMTKSYPGLTALTTLPNTSPMKMVLFRPFRSCKWNLYTG